MDELFALLGLVAVALPVLVIIALIWTNRLAKELRELRAEHMRLAARVAGLRQAAETEQAAPSKPAPAAKSAEAAADVASPWSAEAKAAVAELEASDATVEPPAAPPVSEPGFEPAGPPKAVVLRADKAKALADWMRANWIYVVSAVSLAFAGLFLVQYGIETGLLTPAARVAVALAFGAALVVGGEYIRRRWGEREEVATAYLPSVFSGAGIVTLFGAVLAALHLYALIGPGLGFAGLVAVAALAIGLGWYSGPLLAALGMVGAFGAPFLTGGESDHPELFYGYFALVALTGLAIDAGRRWAWVSVLALAGAYPAVTLLWLGAGWPELYTLVLVALVLAAMAIPTFTLSPAHGGAAVIEGFAKGRPRGWPEFPTRLVAGSMLASVAGLGWMALGGAAEFWLAALGLIALLFAIAVWADRAEALEDLAILPALALVALPAGAAINFSAPYAGFRAVLDAEEGTPVPNDPYLIVALGVAASLIAAWRSRRGGRWPVAWGAGAALIAPLTVGALEFFWVPGDLFGPYPWALVVIAVAGAMVALSLGFVKSDGARRPRVAGFALAAFALIALALALVFTKAALTLAFAVLTLAAAALDRRFALRPLAVAVQVGAIGLTYRLLIDPGLGWAHEKASWGEMILTYGGSVAAVFAALWLYRPLTRPAAKVVAESAGWTLATVFVSLVLIRLLDQYIPGNGTESHWFAGVLTVIWLAAAANQLWRTQLGGLLGKLRWVLAAIYGLVAGLVLLLDLTIFNPVVWYSSNSAVHGWPLINTLLVGYLLPAVAIGGLGWRFGFLPRWLRIGLMGLGTMLGVLWLFLTIRHFWRGAEMDASGFTDPELYTYTIAMLLGGAGLLYQAIARRSDGLRKAAMVVIGLTVAKVFLVDISGLVGLYRVFSFLVLGFSLAGLAFLNRWAAGQIAEGEDKPDAPNEPPGHG